MAEVEVEDDRDIEKLALVETVFVDWLEKRVCLLARFSRDAFLVCEGARLGMLGASRAAGAGFCAGAGAVK